MNIPAELNYTKEHEWIKVDGDIATIGITDFAQGELGDIVFVDVSTVGQSLAAGEIFGSVEAVKTVSDLYMPVSGELLELNADLDGNPENINSDAYNSGWMVKVKMSNPAELDSLLDASSYSDLVG